MYEIDWDFISKMADLAQLVSFMMETEDVSNSFISKKLESQDNNYLKIILSNQKEIMDRLGKMEEKLNEQ